MSGIGIDEQAQQRYLDSSARREAVRSILRSEPAGGTSIQSADFLREDATGFPQLVGDDAFDLPQNPSTSVPDFDGYDFDRLNVLRSSNTRNLPVHSLTWSKA